MSIHKTTDGDIFHYHHILTKAYCLLQADFGSGLGEFLNNFSRKVIGRSDKCQSVGHTEQEGILTNFSSTVISCVSCPGFAASFDVDVLVDLKKKVDVNMQSKSRQKQTGNKQVNDSLHLLAILEEAAGQGCSEKKETRRESPPPPISSVWCISGRLSFSS